MGSIVSAIEDDAYDDYCAECRAAGKEPDDWYSFRGRARQYIEEAQKRRTTGPSRQRTTPA